MHKLLIGFTIFFATPACAQNSETPFLFANWFVRNCASANWQLACGSYTIGYFHGVQTRKMDVCLPEGVDTIQLYEVAIAHMRAHPEKGHLAGITLMDEAWKSAFPCK